MPGDARNILPAMGADKIHRKRNFADKSIEQVAFDVMFSGHRCNGCGSPKPCIRIQMFCALADLPPALKVTVAQMRKAGELRTMRLKQAGNPNGQPGIRVGEAYACANCQREAEITAAKAPSYYVVAIDRQEQTAGAQVTGGGLVLLPSLGG